MFAAVSGTQQAMLYLAIILAVGFTAFTLFAIVPLVRLLQEQARIIQRLKGFDQNFSKSTESTKSTKSAEIGQNCAEPIQTAPNQ